MSTLYDDIGKHYSSGRKTDPFIQAQLMHFFDGATLMLNIGAGTGSYESDLFSTIALEPSWAMIQQRPAKAAPVVQGQAENLPFADKIFSHSMTILSMHHWQQRSVAFEEIKRVTCARFVAVTWDPEAPPFWLTSNYFPELYEIDCTLFPSKTELEKVFEGIHWYPLMIPSACEDGFTAAFWSRPHCYLDPRVRAGMSTFAKIGCIDEPLDRLQRDLNSGDWHRRFGQLLVNDRIDVGYRIGVWDAR